MTGAFVLSDRNASRRPEPVLPMVNLVFLLLVFFLMAAIIAPRPPVAVREPRAIDPGGIEPVSLRIAVASDGTVHFGEATGAAALAGVAAELAGPSGSLAVAIHADGDAPANTVVRLTADLGSLSSGPVWLVAAPVP